MKNLLLLIMILFIAGKSGMQAQGATDTLTMVKTLMEKGKNNASLELMKKYRDDHPGDLYASWIYAQAAGQARKYRLSASLYKESMQLAPGIPGLRLEYAKALAASGKLDLAEQQFDTCAGLDPDNPEPWLWLARIRYWRGDYRKATAMVDNLILHAPDFKEAGLLKNQIEEERSPTIGLEIPFSSDDQPLLLISPVLTGIWRHSNALGLDIRLYSPISVGNDLNFASFGFSAGNKFRFPKAGLSLNLNLGFFNHTSLDTWNWTGAIKIEKTLIRKLQVWVDARRQPYLYTLSSLQRPVMENHFVLAAAWNDPDRWNGQISAEASTFSTDDNLISSFAGWLFAPAIKAGRFDFHFGYGYNYSNSRDNNFVSEESTDQIRKRWNRDSTIAGVYDPYFTPNEQQVHSLLGIINLRAAKQLNLSLKFNAGLYATAMVPYLYLNTDASDSLFVDRSFAKESFHPLSVTAGMGWKMPEGFSLSAEFSYISTIYYRTYTGGITLRKRF